MKIKVKANKSKREEDDDNKRRMNESDDMDADDNDMEIDSADNRHSNIVDYGIEELDPNELFKAGYGVTIAGGGLKFVKKNSTKEDKKSQGKNKDKGKKKRKHDDDNDEDKQEEEQKDMVKKPSKIEIKNAMKLWKPLVYGERSISVSEKKALASKRRKLHALTVKSDDPEESASEQLPLSNSNATAISPPVINNNYDNSSKSNSGNIGLNEMKEWIECGLDQQGQFLLGGLHQIGFKKPTLIQQTSIPQALLFGRDVLGAAETGSGKTLAYGLPILHFLIESFVSNTIPFEQRKADTSDEVNPLALILVPTRELALQVKQHLDQLIENARNYRKTLKGLPPVYIPDIIALVGGLSEQKQARVLRSNPEIIIATPGRLWALIDSNEISSLGHLQFLVFDEADRMVDRGHFPEVNSIIKRVTEDEKKLQEKKQGLSKRYTMLFSATLLVSGPSDVRKKFGAKNSNNNIKNKKEEMQSPLLEIMYQIGRRGKPAICTSESVTVASSATELAKVLVSQKTNDPKQSKLHEEELKKEKSRILKLPDNLELFKILCPSDEEKDTYLHYFVSQNLGRTLIFVNTISALQRVTEVMKLLAANQVLKNRRLVVCLHAHMQQRQRMKHLENFRKSKDGILIATDVAARGLDIPAVSYVIHHAIPQNAQIFVHRSGRTARADQKGVCLSLVTAKDAKPFRIICQTLAESAGKQELKELQDYPVLMKRLDKIKSQTALARKIQSLQSKRTKMQNAGNWLAKAAQEAGIILDEKELAIYGDVLEKKDVRFMNENTKFGDDDEIYNIDKQRKNIKEKRELYELQRQLAAHLSASN